MAQSESEKAHRPTDTTKTLHENQRRRPTLESVVHDAHENGSFLADGVDVKNVSPTIVVIEDEPQLLALLEDILTLEHYRVIGVPHPNVLNDRIDQEKPDLFLIDIMLPGTSGIELAEHLRAHGYAGIPMIAMSASKLMTGLASRSEAFVTALDKPFDIDDLLTSLQGYLSRPTCDRR